MKPNEATWKHDPMAHDAARELLVGLVAGAALAVLSATWWLWVVR